MSEFLEKPRRKFWQFHLSTAIVMMFVAGGWLWANMRPVSVVRRANGEIHVRGSGWPCAYTEEFSPGYQELSDAKLQRDCDPPLASKIIIWTLNVLAGTVIILILAAVSEWIARRRERSARGGA